MRAADRGAQTIVDEYLHNRQVREITFREILVQIGQLGTPYLTSDVSELAAQYLADKGMKM